MLMVWIFAKNYNSFMALVLFINIVLSILQIYRWAILIHYYIEHKKVKYIKPSKKNVSQI